MINVDAALLTLIAKLQRFRSERGQTLAEYSLLVTIVAVGVTVAALVFFRGALEGAYTGVADCMLGTC